jgi:flagellar protein FliL
MADKKKDADKKPSFLKSKKGIILIVVVLVAAYGGYTFMKPKPKFVAAQGETVAIDPTTLNLAGGHYLKIAFSVELVKGKATAAKFEPAAAQSLIISQYSDRTVDSLSSNKSRDTMQTNLLAGLKKAYPDEIWGLQLTQFVTQ